MTPSAASGDTDRSGAPVPARIGRFRVVRLLGRGGMGSVYLAEDDRGGLVAVKVLDVGAPGPAASRTRFRREVVAAFRVSSPWMPRVVAAHADATTPYLVTEYVDGPTLARRVETAGPLDADAVRLLARHLAAAIGAVHRIGLVHRDVKPSNVLLSDTGPKLIDLGIVYAVDSDDTATCAGIAIGTRTWMSPEQARGEEVGPATDVFGWGATVAYAATGRPPFGTGPAEAVLYRVVHEQPDLAGLHGAAGELVAAALTRDPSSRPTLDAITAGLDGAPQEMPAPTVAPTLVASTTPPAAVTAPTRIAPVAPGTDRATGSRRRGRRLAVGIALALLAVLGGFQLVRALDDDVTPDAPARSTSTSTPAASVTSTAPSTSPTTTPTVPAVGPGPTADPGTGPKPGKGPKPAKGPKAGKESGAG